MKTIAGQKWHEKGHVVDFEINPFLANVPIHYPLKTPENLQGV